MSRLIYISHPNVHIDPDVAVPQWRLSDVGRDRAAAMLDQPWVSSIAAVSSSPEHKAQETAGILADHLGLSVEVVDRTGEIDRSATGYVPEERHEELRRRLFAEPDHSADGWERASDATHRLVTRLGPLLRAGGRTTDSDVAVVGHGGVGTLLLCHLLGIEPDQAHDQPGQGHYWIYDVTNRRVLHEWRPIDITVQPEDPRTDDIVALLSAHLDFARQTSPPDHVHALDVDGLVAPDVSFFAARRAGELLAVGALRHLGDGRAEIKSMHTAAAARGAGIGRLVLDHLLDVANADGCHWVGLETGTMDEFAPARRLYVNAGFVECEPFGNYTVNRFSICMNLLTR